MTKSKSQELTLAEAAARLGITANALRNRAKQGAITTHQNSAGVAVVDETELARHEQEWRPRVGFRTFRAIPTDGAPSAFGAGFGSRVAKAMEAGGVTRAQLVYALSSPEQLVAESDVRRWASGKSTPRAERIGSLADALGVTVDYLLGRSENPLGVVVPGWGEVGFAPETSDEVLRALVAEAERRSGAGASRSSKADGRSPNPARPRRARQTKPE